MPLPLECHLRPRRRLLPYRRQPPTHLRHRPWPRQAPPRRPPLRLRRNARSTPSSLLLPQQQCHPIATSSPCRPPRPRPRLRPQPIHHLQPDPLPPPTRHPRLPRLPTPPLPTPRPLPRLRPRPRWRQRGGNESGEVSQLPTVVAPKLGRDQRSRWQVSLLWQTPCDQDRSPGDSANRHRGPCIPIAIQTRRRCQDHPMGSGRTPPRCHPQPCDGAIASASPGINAYASQHE